LQSLCKGVIYINNYKLIFQPYVARHLLKLGNPIVDIKPDKEKIGHTIFVFEQTEKFKIDLATILK